MEIKNQAPLGSKELDHYFPRYRAVTSLVILMVLAILMTFVIQFFQNTSVMTVATLDERPLKGLRMTARRKSG
jgi:hypothetical protein